MHISALMGTGAVASRLGIDRRTVLQRVASGKLTPVQKLDGPRGTYLFDAEQIERIATDAAPTEKEGAAS